MAVTKDNGTSYGVRRKARIALDPGHGGESSPGCSYPPLTEKVYVLAFARMLRERLEARGYALTMTRIGDVPVTFTQRARLAEAFGADLAISIHVNASTNVQAHGMQCYYMPDDELARRLAVAINERAPEKVKRRTHAVIPASLDGQGDDAVLQRYEMPAVLVELGFASNAEDRAYLLSERGQEQLAAAITTGIDNYLAELPQD